MSPPHPPPSARVICWHKCRSPVYHGVRRKFVEGETSELWREASGNPGPEDAARLMACHWKTERSRLSESPHCSPSPDSGEGGAEIQNIQFLGAGAARKYRYEVRHGAPCLRDQVSPKSAAALLRNDLGLERPIPGYARKRLVPGACRAWQREHNRIKPAGKPPPARVLEAAPSEPGEIQSCRNLAQQLLKSPSGSYVSAHIQRMLARAAQICAKLGRFWPKLPRKRARSSWGQIGPSRAILSLTWPRCGRIRPTPTDVGDSSQHSGNVG